MTEREIFVHALSIADSGTRNAWLDDVCAGDTNLRQRVATLLESHDQTNELLDRPAANLVDNVHLDESFWTRELKPSHQVPERIGVYTIQSILGRGGMGVVYKATHTRLEKTVALKALPPEALASPKAKARFEREMKAVGKLADPHLVSALDAGESDMQPFLVMEYIDGTDLLRLVRERGVVPLAEACEIARQTALGLQAVHDHHMVHRDIKPSNLMLTPDGQVKIFDLGLALLRPRSGQYASGDDELTSVNRIMGTIDYMAPEQCLDSHAVDIRADIYALGASLHQFLTGRIPCPDYSSDTVDKRLAARRLTEPTSIRLHRSDLPKPLVDLIDSMLDKDCNKRPSEPKQVAEALEPFASGHDLSHWYETGTSVSPTDQHASRFRLGWPLAVGALVMVVVLGWLCWPK